MHAPWCLTHVMLLGILLMSCSLVSYSCHAPWCLTNIMLLVGLPYPPVQMLHQKRPIENIGQTDRHTDPYNTFIQTIPAILSNPYDMDEMKYKVKSIKRNHANSSTNC